MTDTDNCTRCKHYRKYHSSQSIGQEGKCMAATLTMVGVCGCPSFVEKRVRRNGKSKTS